MLRVQPTPTAEPQRKFLTPICTKTTHRGTILERIGPCLRVISEFKHRLTCMRVGFGLISFVLGAGGGVYCTELKVVGLKMQHCLDACS